MSGPDLSDPVQARAHALELLRSHSQVLFANPRWNSVTLCVAQYYDDSAEDAVHHLLVLSVERGPAWPHHCADWRTRDQGIHEEACDYCDGSVPWMPDWHANGWVIRPFEPFCREGITQHDDHEDAYLPYAVARRAGSGVEIEVVGVPVRPWLLGLPPVDPNPDLEPLLHEVYAHPSSDVPRQVLADLLQERGDPRGSFIARQLAGADGDDLLQGHELEWTGPIAPVCDATRTVFRRGFPAEVRVCFATHQATELARHPAWRTVEAVEWHAQSVIALPDLPVCTRMDEVPIEALDALDPILPQLVHLSLRIEHLDPGPDRLLESATCLRSLRVDHPGFHRANLPWDRLQRLEVTSREIEDWLELAHRHGIGELIVHGSARVRWAGEVLELGEPVYSGGNQQARLDEIRRFQEWFSARGIRVRAFHDGLPGGDELVEAFDG